MCLGARFEALILINEEYSTNVSQSRSFKGTTCATELTETSTLLGVLLANLRVRKSAKELSYTSEWYSPTYVMR
jgi:hypothetical protein